MKGAEPHNKILSAENSAMAITTMDGEILSVNSELRKFLGYEDEALVGKPLQFLFADELPKELSDHAIFEIQVLQKNGDHLSVQVEISHLKIGSNSFRAVLITDLSARRKQRAKILQLNSDLEKKVGFRTEALKHTIEELEIEINKRKEAEYRIKESLEKERELSELKTKFLSMVSHEFKTPLSAILSSATLAGKYTLENQQENRDKHLNIIRSKVKYLNGILNDFLSIQRLESGKISYTFNDFPLSRVINKVIYDSNMLSKAGQQIIYPDHIENIIVHYDEKILETALTNLINNSIKYSPEDSVIDVSVKIGDHLLTINVADQGIGIPESEQKFIFNPYFRAANVLTNQGTGVGLNIVKGHLQNLDSSITFKSKEGKGSIFSITIPYQPQEN